MLEIPVGSEENIEAIGGKPQQLAILSAGPAQGSDGTHLVAREQCCERAR